MDDAKHRYLWFPPGGRVYWYDGIDTLTPADETDDTPTPTPGECGAGGGGAGGRGIPAGQKTNGEPDAQVRP